jgi:hypothetical protein
MHAYPCLSQPSYLFPWLLSVSMLGVLGSTGACGLISAVEIPLIIKIDIDTSLRAIGTRAHAMHSLAFFSSYSIIVSTVGWVLCLHVSQS